MVEKGKRKKKGTQKQQGKRSHGTTLNPRCGEGACTKKKKELVHGRKRANEKCEKEKKTKGKSLLKETNSGLCVTLKGKAFCSSGQIIL